MEAITLLSGSIDALLGLALLSLAWLALSSEDLFKSIVMFIAFGLLMALAWVRLDAPDIALAEAAIGAGLTGALLLAGLTKLQAITAAQDTNITTQQPSSRQLALRWIPAIVMLCTAAGLGYCVVSLPPHAVGLSAEVAANLDVSGVTNPVTAVLLNFRGYDTLLEMVVLLLALLAVWSFDGPLTQVETAAGPVLDILARLLLPLLILVSAYLLWVGAHAPGGAFQAGSVLGAAGVLSLLAGWKLQPSLAGLPLRLVFLCGSATFIIIAVLTMFYTGRLLQYPPTQAGILMIILETAATVSIGAILAALFLGAQPTDKRNQ